MENQRPKIGATRTEERTKKIEKVLSHRHKDFTIVAENLTDPHNISAVFRSCDAVGILDAHIVYNLEVNRPKLADSSSASARKWVNAIYHNSIEDCFKVLRAEGKRIYTTHLSHDAVSLYDIDLTVPFALVLGNERHGVSDEALALADQNVLIPQVGMIQSLNISVACAVSIYEAFRQRQKAGKYDQRALPDEDYELILKDWLER